MANEITLSVSLALANGGRETKKSYGGVRVDQTGNAYTSIIQNIGTSEEQLDFGDIATPGYVLFRNLDSTNYVELRAGTGVADMVRLDAGEVCLFRFAADCTAPYAIANTAAVDLEMTLLEA